MNDYYVEDDLEFIPRDPDDEQTQALERATDREVKDFARLPCGCLLFRHTDGGQHSMVACLEHSLRNSAHAAAMLGSQLEGGAQKAANALAQALAGSSEAAARERARWSTLGAGAGEPAAPVSMGSYDRDGSSTPAQRRHDRMNGSAPG